MDPVEAAQAASLRYVSDATPGISRRAAGQGFSYYKPDGTRVTNALTLERIRQIVIPPAWTDVWIAAAPNAHIQATGRDARGRKQHRYHERWRAVRDEEKFARLAAFGRALPAIRRRVSADLAQPGLPRTKVFALLVWFLERTYVRIGNEEYARTNKSYGLTTLTNRHVQVEGAGVQLRFIGKSRKPHDIRLTDRRIAGLMRKLRELPGQDLFQYVREDGAPHGVTSSDVNDYLREISGGEFTAKDFRTWAGTLLAVRQLADLSGATEKSANAKDSPPAMPSATRIKARSAAAVKAVAEALRNTPAVCRKCYIHPSVLAAWNAPALLEQWRTHLSKARDIDGLNAEEAALVAYLEEAIVPEGPVEARRTRRQRTRVESGTPRPRKSARPALRSARDRAPRPRRTG